MSPERPIILVGAGNMGGAILKGWVADGVDTGSIYVADPGLNADMKAYLDQNNIRYFEAAPSDVTASVLMLAVKPQVMEKVAPGFMSSVDQNTLVVSIAAGVTIAFLKSQFSEGYVVRTMPNTPAMVGRGITGIVAEDGVDKAGRELIGKLMGVCGSVEWLDDEKHLDALTAVSGSGPAYVYLLAECMAEAGRKAGLDEQLAMRLARATVSGAGELMQQSPEAASTLRQNVTSPGGTTAAALSVLMGDDAMQELFDRAIAAAKIRSEELAGQ